MLVVNDPPLAEAIGRLRGEWSVRSGGQLEATSTAWQKVDSADQLDADVVLFPARYLGTLCERGWLRPVRRSVLDGNTYDAEDVLPLVRQNLIRYGGHEMALPLGVEMPLVGYRPDWLAQRQGEPPRSWDEYRELVERGDAPLWWPPAASVDHPEAMLLLAHAAAYAVLPSREGVLFDPQTMKARIAAPPFVLALDQWCHEPNARVAGVERSAPPANLSGVAGVERSDPPAASATPTAEVIWANLPGSDELYDHLTGQWESAERGTRQVPLLGGGGSLAGVTTTSRNATSAFQLLAWLTGSEIGGQIGPKAIAALPCRRSELRAVRQWFAPPLPLGEGRGEGALFGDTGVAQAVQSALSGDVCLVVPPLPGIDQYLAALDDGVQQALAGKSSAADALAQVARQWDRITAAHGRQAQRRAYLNHLGIADPYVPVGGK